MIINELLVQSNRNFLMQLGVLYTIIIMHFKIIIPFKLIFIVPHSSVQVVLPHPYQPQSPSIYSPSHVRSVSSCSCQWCCRPSLVEELQPFLTVTVQLCTQRGMSSGATQLMVTEVLLSEVIVRLKDGDGCDANHDCSCMRHWQMRGQVSHLLAHTRSYQCWRSTMCAVVVDR